jgi:RecA/RadA recombinase
MKKARKGAILDEIVSDLRKRRPRSDEQGTFEVSRSSVEILSKVKYTLLTGIDSFDECTGGLPFGRIVELYGLEASGKTAMCIRSMIRAQQRHIYERIKEDDGKITLKRVPKDAEVVILCIDNEQSFDADEKVTYKDPDDGQTYSLDIALARCDTVDQLFKMSEAVITKMSEYRKKNPDKLFFVVIVVDTIAGTSSKEELTADWNKEDYQRQPKQLRRGFRRLQRKVNRENVCMICTNQVSDSYAQKGAKRGKSMVPQDSDFSTFGGRALKFFASLRIFMYKVTANYRLSKGVRFSQGFLLGFFTSKNRFKKPCRSGRVALLFDGGLSNEYSTLETLIYLRLAKYDGEQIAFRFSAAGITPETFGPRGSDGEGMDLEEEDDAADEAGRGRNPKCPSRAAWPSFYQTHRTDIDKLWEKGIDILFGSESASDFSEAGDGGDDDVIDVEDDEEKDGED